MAAVRSSHVDPLQSLRDELTPFPGRLSGSLRDALAIAIALVTTMTLRVTGIALALSLLFLLQRERPGLTLRSAAQILGGGITACAATLFWVQVTDGTEVARYLGLVLGIFIAAFGMATTTLPLFFTLFGFYGFVDLSAWDGHHTPTAMTTTSLYGIASLAIVMFSAVGVEYIFGTRHPAKELEKEMLSRLSILSRFFSAMAEDPSIRDENQLRSLRNTMIKYAHASEVRLNRLYERMRDIAPSLAELPLGTHYRIGLLARVLEKSTLIGFERVSESDRPYYSVIAAQCASLIDDKGLRSRTLFEPQPYGISPQLLDIHTELKQYAASLASPKETANLVSESATRSTPSFRLFRFDAIQSNAGVTYALKLTLAATLCYTIYNAVAWPGVLTCVITVLFTGLSPTGQMKQKQLYRFLGTAVGGVFAIAAESLLFPNMDSITSLVLVVAAVAFIAGWVLRSPHMGSVGTQIGFAFFLTTLQGFGATTQIATARDRIMGVTLGIAVMWFVFDQLWPTRTSEELSHILRRIRDAALQLRQIDHQHPESFAQALTGLRVTVSLDLASMQLLESGVYFDVGRGHKRELVQSRRLVRKIESAASEFYTEALRVR